ncbi:Zn(II)2Cys6 transcription factor domain-containing protein [Aspergillus stella-maris]|uniref:Zn(II)2Cys6 transcription factor domain-containing protein n=1 Tax=Aspergillus stella-maris TaxID=1810926 RepID=UPI003CCD2B2E
MGPLPPHQTNTTTVPIPIAASETTTTPSTSTSSTSSEPISNEDTDTTQEKPSKPRPITSCSACRARKIKCNKSHPCTACIARNQPEQCSYSSTSEERSAIASADLISELRGARNKLQNQVNRRQLAEVAAARAAYGSRSGSGGATGKERELSEREVEEKRVLEGVWWVLRSGEVGVVREVVGRIRGGEGWQSVLDGVGVAGHGGGAVEV